MPENTNRNSVFLSSFVLFAINVLNFYDRNILGSIAEPLRRDFHINDAHIGLLGSAFIWVYAIVGLPLGRVADCWSRKKLLTAGILVWTSLTAGAAFAGSYTVLLFTRMGVGIGEATCAPTATSWLGDLFPADKRSRVLALFMLALPIGGGLNFFLSGRIAQAFGWRAAMVVAAVPAVLLIPALLALREPARGASELNYASQATAPAWTILRIPTLWWIIASGALVNFNSYAFGTFLPAFLSRVHGLSLAASGTATSVIYIVGGVIGATLAGKLGDSIVHRRKDGRLLIAAALALIGAPLGCFGFLQPVGSILISVIFVGLAYAALTTYYGLVYSAIQDIVAPAQRGTTMAFYFMAMYMCGASFGPLLTGRLSDFLAQRAAVLAGSAVVNESYRAIGLQQAMQVIPALSVALAFVLYMGSRTIVADMQRREELSAAPAIG